MVGTTVYIGGLNSRASEDDVGRFFKDYSSVREITVKTGFAFAEFEDEREAEDAINEMNGKVLLGNRVTVERGRGTAQDRFRRGGGRFNSSYQPRGSRPPYRRNFEGGSRNYSDRQGRDHSRERNERQGDSRRGGDYNSYSRSSNNGMDDRSGYADRS